MVNRKLASEGSSGIEQHVKIYPVTDKLFIGVLSWVRNSLQ